MEIKCYKNTIRIRMMSEYDYEAFHGKLEMTLTKIKLVSLIQTILKGYLCFLYIFHFFNL